MSAPVSRDDAGRVSPPVPGPATDPNAIHLAGMAGPFPGILPPLPPFVPGTPEWTENYIRAVQGLINAFRKLGGGRGGGRRNNDDDDDDYCGKRLAAEIARCYKRREDTAHQDFFDGCIERAKERWASCIRNKGRPHPDEPNEWGPDDEEIWRNYGR
jgi:hypothetical protein